MDSDKLERLANVAIVFAAITCVGVWGWYASAAAPPERPVPPKYNAGDSLATVGELGSDSARPTLLLFVSPVCRYCTESMPFYRELVSSGAASGHRIVFAGREHIDDLREYLQTYGLPLEQVDLVRFRSGGAFKHAATPTVFVVDPQRRIKQMWTGKMTSESEMSLLAILKAPVAADYSSGR